MAESLQNTCELSVVGSMDDIGREEWNACAGIDHPFTRHEFLAALEESGSAEPETGWGPRHLVLRDHEQRLIGCAPAYLKGHSQGEYIFDHGWANAYERAGGRYYPKLLIAIPFTPATGPRLLAHPDIADRQEVQSLLAQGARAVCDRLDLSGLHINFTDDRETEILRADGMLHRTGEQFHWLNDDYGNFDDFLMALSSRKRKAIRRERRDALAAGLTIDIITGSDLREDHWDAFFHFYMDTGSRKWGTPYLTREFFSLISERMSDQIVLMLSRRPDGHPIAGALNFTSSETLYGRYWGCTEHHPFLHFELCYYQAIEWAIDHGLKRVEAGAQGPHKLARGYLPTHTSSCHYLPNESFAQAVSDYLEHERREVDMEIEHLDRFSPFRQAGPYTPDEGAV